MDGTSKKKLKRPKKERHYIITAILPFKGTLSIPGEKMEPGKVLSDLLNPAGKGGGSAHIHGKNGEAYLVKYIEEEVVWMPDYEFDDKCELRSVRFDPVTVMQHEKICVVRSKI